MDENSPIVKRIHSNWMTDAAQRTRAIDIAIEENRRIDELSKMSVEERLSFLEAEVQRAPTSEEIAQNSISAMKETLDEFKRERACREASVELTKNDVYLLIAMLDANASPSTPVPKQILMTAANGGGDEKKAFKRLTKGGYVLSARLGPHSGMYLTPSGMEKALQLKAELDH